jgi:hypothetical protein
MSPAQAQELRSAIGAVEAASKLISNFDVVLNDICPTGAGASDTPMTQPTLKRLDSVHNATVNAMLKEVYSRLLGNDPKMPGKEALMVWAQAARYFGLRIQDPESEACGRAPDMSMEAAGRFRGVLARIEAACLLAHNQERVVKDITNAGPKNIDGKDLTQTDLARVSGNSRGTVDNMIKALIARLQGQDVSVPTPQDAGVWAQAAAYFSGRIQGSVEECPFRAPDMSANAAGMMRKVLGQIEACSKLVANREKCVQDITNSAPQTQKNLTRVDSSKQAAVAAMLSEVCVRLLSNKSSYASGDAQAWADAAVYFHGRIQSSAGECKGRAADMSGDAAAAMRKVLAQIANQPGKTKPELEAFQKLASNCERVVLDITNSGSKNIDGKELTQTDLKRLDSKDRAAVAAMITEVCCRLAGQSASQPSNVDGRVWGAAAQYLSGRIQDAPNQMPGRQPDMSAEAAAALRAALK